MVELHEDEEEDRGTEDRVAARVAEFMRAVIRDDFWVHKVGSRVMIGHLPNVHHEKADDEVVNEVEGSGSRGPIVEDQEESKVQGATSKFRKEDEAPSNHIGLGLLDGLDPRQTDLKEPLLVQVLYEEDQ
eukprot:CAMPEP_0170562426 /NCGR_PEP_ID=MMETSP0211-20121228/60494_1 /TAXON_ID=311385 /ORGANISM="Pseudokeronopsis sp., Strain OXSARD2" /LENGTH=129 /DNA_ID=CAMNT_0010879297 /DNA_START=802 /DNA_END=1188 /DNA_ORIENTATION=+